MPNGIAIHQRRRKLAKDIVPVEVWLAAQMPTANVAARVTLRWTVHWRKLQCLARKCALFMRIAQIRSRKTCACSEIAGTACAWMFRHCTAKNRHCLIRAPEMCAKPFGMPQLEHQSQYASTNTFKDAANRLKIALIKEMPAKLQCAARSMRMAKERAVWKMLAAAAAKLTLIALTLAIHAPIQCVICSR